SAQEKYRIRCGSYRILYSIEDDILIIFIVKVGHRKDVYRGN
ncbi:MAG: type II toxin-antitoxin system RelE/ParE family toxin, partial [Candidatus Nealsonbacteria bacterium]|nr:type II toxin-antitoxin system RelE/ParE family toxin [Candidatus Nealsonbacteria bacterium]